MKTLLRTALLLLPLFLTPLFGYLLAEGILNLGGGEKDMLWVIPWAIGSMTYLITGFILWRKVESNLKLIRLSMLWSVGIVVLLWLALWTFSWANIGFG